MKALTKKMQITIELFRKNPFLRHLKCIIWDKRKPQAAL
ncbi:hypothetical protein DBT_1463 [Dissulfuribacter thermophilus]|uniref:Uncharacterized protein n=1 Tax=Dissulfuribacter thermophilus TaxID=1156395 RepID=A0A1B9F4V6_9BACT|nr:hypothetical protein DBT_1463 [Dissulfuribacter thermophilus]